MSTSIASQHAERPDHRTVFLPVTRSTVTAFLDDGAIPDLPIERAALFVLMMFSTESRVIEKTVNDALSEAEEAFIQNADEAGRAALQETRSEHPELTEETLGQVLRTSGFTLVDQLEMDKQLWRGPLGRYHPVFQERCKSVIKTFEFNADAAPIRSAAHTPYSPEQDRAAREGHERVKVRIHSTDDQARFVTKVAADRDEIHALHGYAGTGKTHLTVTLHERLGGLKHVLLRASDREAFKHRTGLRDIQTITLANIATRMFADTYRGTMTPRQAPPKMGPGDWDLGRQADEIGIPRSGVGRFPAAVVMGHAITVVRRFCRTEASMIEPIMCTGFGYDPAELPVLTGYAQRLWATMFEPVQFNAPQPFALWEYHLAKWLSLKNAQIPRMGLLAIDEGHDLQPAWVHLLSGYRDGLLLMSDPYQRLTGLTKTPEHAIRSSIGQSVRTGQHAIPTINGVLSRHSEPLMGEELRGDREHDTQVRTYTNREDVRDMGLRVYGSVWQLFADAMRMRDAGNDFSVLHVSFGVLKAVLTEVLALYKFGDKPRQRELAGITTREGLDAHLAAIGQDKIRRMLAKGFSFDDASRFVRDVQAKNEGAAQRGSAGIVLGLLEHTRNLEASVVYLSPCCFSTTDNPAARTDRDRHIRSIYLSMTRVRDELWMPADAMDGLHQ